MVTQQTEARNTGLSVLSLNFLTYMYKLTHYTNLSISEKSPHQKVFSSLIPVVYFIGYNNISW